MADLREVVIPSKVHRLLKDISPLLFERVTKINDHRELQQRFILLTRTWFFSLKKNFLGNYKVRRGFEITNIQGIVWRPSTLHFILKIEPQICGDYHFESDCIERLITVFTAVRPDGKLWLVDDDIEAYQRQKKKLAEVDVNLMPSSRWTGRERRDTV